MRGYLFGAVLILAGAAVAASPLVGRVHETLVQSQMLAQFEALRQQVASAPPAVAAPAEAETKPAQASPPKGPYRLDIPAAGIQVMVLDGLDDATLAKGPAHYTETPQPGMGGNAAIAGHRTVRGQPSFFYHLDRVKPGDAITVTYAAQRLTYTVDRVFLTGAYDRSVLAPTTGEVLTLTTCDPPGTADQRLVVRARLVSTGAP